MNLIFSAGSIDECLEKASEKLNIAKDKLEYNVLKEERRFFKKKITIEVKNEIKHKITNEENIEYGAKVEDGKIIVKSFKDESKCISIKSCDGVNLFYNGNRTESIENAKESDIIECTIEESPNPSRLIEISVSEDKMEAYITIKSIPQKIYILKDCGLSENLVLNKTLSEKKYAAKCTYDDIKDALKDKKITYGILEDTIRNVCNEDEVKNVLIAKGVQAIDDTPEKMDILFKDLDQVEERGDTEVKIDYRNRFMLATVHSGQEIAKITPSIKGKDGKDVYGNDVKHKESFAIKFKIGQGCKYENNKVISTIEGKPYFKSNTFNVHQVYQVEEVNLSTGNINFVADVEVAKTVEEGMEIVSGNTVLVGKNVESAKITASSDVTINGNAINSTIIAGQNSMNKKKYLLSLNNVKNIVAELYSAVIQVSNNSILEGRKPGELIKILIENKYKGLVTLCEEILKECELQGIKDSPITSFIKKKIIGFGPLNIKGEEELLDFIDFLNEEAEELETFEVDEANIRVKYIQSSKLETIGSVFIEGKGQYTSEITALNSIEFLQENSVCRGGILSAGKEIKLKTVGSEAGVNTILKVAKDGVITADIAYNNTTFCFGEKQLILDVSSRNVKAYVDDMGDIVIDKLLL